MNIDASKQRRSNTRMSVRCPISLAKMARHAPSPLARKLPISAVGHRGWQSIVQWLPLWMVLALVPPILLIWFHLADLHSFELWSLALGNTASLGFVLFFSLISLTYLLLCLIFPSSCIAAAASFYGRGKVPDGLATIWTAGIGLMAVFFVISATNPAFSSSTGFGTIILAATTIVGAGALCVAYPRRATIARRANLAGNGRRDYAHFPLAIANAALAFVAFTAVTLPLHFLAKGDAAQPTSPDIRSLVFLTAIAITLACGPGLAYMWTHRPGRQPMNFRSFIVLLLIPPIGTIFLSLSLPTELKQLTLISTGIVAPPNRTQLYRLPDSWTQQDARRISATFNPTKCQPPESAPEPNQTAQEPTLWLCGHLNFSFGRVRLVCDKPYMDSKLQFIKNPLTCAVFVDSDLTNLITLPPPGPIRSAQQPD
ncbi:hypothetical protein [Achromobacter pestifer]